VKVPPPELPSTEWSYEDPDYLDPAKLERELRRVGEICHQCRRCLPLCPSFPKLFELVDATEREIEGVTMDGFERVNELCFHCKLCYNHCPYTPPHEWDVDFPALMRRHQLARAERDGTPLARKLTTRTDLIGRIGSAVPPLMNLANRNRLSRVLMEKTLGIDRDWVQPSYYHETVERWFARRGPRGEGAAGTAVLFTTCSVNYSDPLVGRAAVEVLEHAGVRVDVCYERCCGMPFTDTGDLGSARANARRNVEALLPYVTDGGVVVAPGPSCSLMLKEEYPRLLPGDRDAQRVAEATRDLMEHVHALAKAGHLTKDFAHPLGRVAYQAPCHLRHQNIGFKSRDLLRWAGAEVTLVDACSGVDGTWGMQKRFHDASLKVARKMLDAIRAAEPDHVSTDCPLSALRIEEGLGRKAVHPVVLLRYAYGLGAEALAEGT
jgi:Fe-S oxidoreductase